MLGIIIVDDEVLVRVGVKSLIDWEAEGYQILGEAGNGAEGLELITTKKPDIVITDIKMPVMDGLEMIKKVQEENLDTKFIILSSFDEFHLVKRAMKWGAVDYLIKLELDEKVLLETLNPVKKLIMKDKKRKSNQKIIKYNIHSENNMRQEFFKKLIGGLINDQETINCLIRELNIKLNEKRLVCLVAKINNLDSLNKFAKKDMQLFEFSVINIVEEIVNDFFTGYAFTNYRGEAVVIYSIPENVKEEEYLTRAEEMASTLTTMLKQYFDITVSIAVCNPHSGLLEISTAYLECSEVMEYIFYSQSGKPLFYKDIKNIKVDKNRDFDLFNSYHDLEIYLETLDKAGIEMFFEDIITNINQRNISRGQAYDLCFQLIIIIKNKFKKDQREELFDSQDAFYSCIHNLSNITDIKEWLKKLQINLISTVTKYSQNENIFLIAQARRYLQQHFKEEITLSELAGKLNISTGYLSTLFKDEVGIGFSEYITQLKIDEAKKLLANSNKQIKEISDLTGYNNPYYFSRVFKKITGQTPSEFRGKKY